jgi:hypothetical protein
MKNIILLLTAVAMLTACKKEQVEVITIKGKSQNTIQWVSYSINGLHKKTFIDLAGQNKYQYSLDIPKTTGDTIFANMQINGAAPLELSILDNGVEVVKATTAGGFINGNAQVGVIYVVK